MDAVNELISVVTPKRTSSAKGHYLPLAMLTSFVSGAFAGIIGLVMSLLSALGLLANDSQMGLIESVMILLSLGLLVTGAHCIDRVKSTDGVAE